MACTSRKLVEGEPVDPRRVIVVIGDGHDNASSKTLDQVIELAQRYQVTINAMSTDAYGFTSDAGKNLVRMTEETGGRVEYPLMNVYKDVPGFLSQPSDEGNYQLKVGTGGYTAAILGSIYKSIANIAGEITVQYVLRYVPNEVDESRLKRSIEVKVDIPNVIVGRAPTITRLVRRADLPPWVEYAMIPWGNMAIATTQLARLSILQLEMPGNAPVSAGVLLEDPAHDRLYLRLRRDWDVIAPAEADGPFRTGIRPGGEGPGAGRGARSGSAPGHALEHADDFRASRSRGRGFRPRRAAFVSRAGPLHGAAFRDASAALFAGGGRGQVSGESGSDPRRR